MVAIYRFMKHYHGIEIWHANATTGACILTSTTWPNKGLGRKERYEVCCKSIPKGLPKPEYIKSSR